MSQDQPTLGMLRRFLRSNGWSKQPIASPTLQLYTCASPEFGVVEVVIPASHGDQRNHLGIEHAIRVLSEFYDVEEEHVKAKVNNIDYDVINTVLPDSSVYKNSIPLRVASACLRSARDLISNAAFCEYEAVAVTSSAQAAKNYADGCRFSHTFPGSFGFRILSHLGPHEEFELGPKDSPPPPERGITRRLCNSVAATASAVQAGNISDIRALSFLNLGLDSDGSSSLARLIERSSAEEVVFSFDFSILWQLPDGEKAQRSFSLSKESTHLIREAAAEMVVRPPETSVVVRGRVTDLHSKQSPMDLFYKGNREIDVKWDSDELGEPTVRIRLSQENYVLAWQAHGRGRDVEIAGNIEMTGAGAFRIMEPTSFKVL